MISFVPSAEICACALAHVAFAAALAPQKLVSESQILLVMISADVSFIPDHVGRLTWIERFLLDSNDGRILRLESKFVGRTSTETTLKLYRRVASAEVVSSDTRCLTSSISTRG